ncbi:MAG TPA: BamA/TamA family outer membrane protein [Bacteroidia bacterium]|nr:BamA/TamA family outer membrane protein [Bacteroidia bacterium]
MKQRVIIVIFIIACALKVQAQKKLSLTILNKDSLTDKDFKLPDYQRKFDQPIQRTKELQRFLFALYDDAYLAASIDSIAKDSVSQKVFLSHGNRYEWASLTKGNVDEGILSQVGYSERFFQHTPFYYKDAFKMMDKILSFYEDHGYPFAQVKLDSVKLQGNDIAASLYLDKKRLEKIDSIVVKGDLKVSPEYLYGYLGIKPGDLYDESKVKVISSRLKSLPILYETKPMQVIFVENKAKIFLYLGRKNANQFNGIIGILPNSAGKINITGDLSLQLQNTFHHAENLGFHWQHIQAQTENLTANFSYPYILKTPIGFDEDFKLFKQDTTYLQIDEKVGLRYLMTGGNYWKVFYENISSSLIALSQLELLTSNLPPYADITTQLYGIEYKAADLDYIYNPRKGYEVLVNVAAGTKVIRKNPQLNPLIYEGLQLNSDEYKANIKAAYYIPFFERSTFKFGLTGGYIDAPSLLLNDLYRIGGFNVLRGFDEQSIYATSYGVGTVEFHYLLEQNSFLFLFFDQGWCKETYTTTISYFNDTPRGFGAGMDFQTKAGIFSISYALGESINNPISFKEGKISFGLINNF